MLSPLVYRPFRLRDQRSALPAAGTREGGDPRRRHARHASSFPKSPTSSHTRRAGKSAPAFGSIVGWNCRSAC